MSEHLKYDHQCKKCGRPFIPLVRCPECGNIETALGAPSIKAFAKAGKANVGCPAFGIWSLADHYIILAAEVFSFIGENPGVLEVIKTKNGVDSIATLIMRQTDLRGAKCLKSHLRTFAKALIMEAFKQKKKKKFKK